MKLSLLESSLAKKIQAKRRGFEVAPDTPVDREGVESAFRSGVLAFVHHHNTSAHVSDRGRAYLMMQQL